MKIKDYKCKCGHNDFFFAGKGIQLGIYCSYCGKWFKWADKDEQNLSMKQEHTGRWIRITNGAIKEKYICSECHRQIEDDGIERLLHIKYPYCHCGAKMGGKSNNE